MMDYIGKEYKISFEVFITKTGADAFHSVIHFTIGGNADQYGDRTPAVWITNTRTMVIASAVSGNLNTNWNFAGIPEQKWIKVEISQTLVEGKYMFEASVEGLPKISVENTQAAKFGPVKVLTGDDWYNPQEGQIRNLVIETKQSYCPDKWHTLSTGCYYFEEKPVTWDEAKSFCSNLGAKMAVVESDAEKNGITEIAKVLIAKKGRFWIDAKMVDNTWKTNDLSVNTAYTPWGGIPTAQDGDCIRTGPKTNWYRWDCNKTT
eukprot:TRINITY_DN2742_c0_g1_i2.p1 TRINITY_DN2742_c0_g1~~TRINITY_DN2742_c0_g1_i2.p1  ORF type:complete len:262 (-),score=44.39 TRINITY_DN2742_c0_g1_i2:443-1228(-)